MQQRLSRAIEEEVVPLRNADDVAVYLDRLRQRALENEKVTALEVQPGVEAIHGIEAVLGPEETAKRIDAFSEEMASLSRRFRHADPPPGAPSSGEVNDLLDETALRQDLTDTYLEKLVAVDDVERQEVLLSRLDAALGRDEPDTPSPALDVLSQTIASAPDNDAKQVAIKAYLDAAQRLPLGEQIDALERLDGLSERKE
jgi:hypothetical protein